jgi:hypothetical protein
MNMNTLLTLSLFLFFRLALAPNPDIHQKMIPHGTSADSMLGRKVKTITMCGTFSLFDKQHSDRAFLKGADGKTLHIIFAAPEMDCFLANHTKDDLQYTYEVHEIEHPGLKAERLNYALRIVSLKSGDDTRTWAQKEAKDSVLMQRHHEQLKEVRGGE